MLAEPVREPEVHPLTADQAHAVETMLSGTPPGQVGGYQAFLLHGVTGSGKTGLCLALLEEAAIDGVPAIVVDPKLPPCNNLILLYPAEALLESIQTS